MPSRDLPEGYHAAPCGQSTREVGCGLRRGLPPSIRAVGLRTVDGMPLGTQPACIEQRVGPCNERAIRGFIPGSTTVNQTTNEPQVTASTAPTDSDSKLITWPSNPEAHGGSADQPATALDAAAREAQLRHYTNEHGVGA